MGVAGTGSRLRSWTPPLAGAVSMPNRWIWLPPRTATLLYYGAACALPLLALIVEHWLDPLTGDTSDQLFLGAVALSAILGGFGSGFCTLAVSGLLKLQFFLVPRVMDGQSAMPRILLFLALGFLLTWLAGAVRSSQRHLHASLRFIGEAVIVTNSRKRVVFMNPVAEALTGWKKKDAAARSFSEVVPLIGESSSKPIDDPVERASQEGTVVSLVKPLILETANGGHVPVEGSIAAMRNDTGKIAGSVTVLRDVSERRALESELRTARKIKALSRLTQPLAYDFNNWLTALGGHAELLRGGLVNADDPALSESAEAIVKVTGQAARLARQFLALRSGPVAWRCQVDLNALTRSMETAIKSVVGDYVTVILALDKALWSVKAVPEQMEQVLINLVANAREAMPKGGILRIHTQNVPRASGRHDGDHVLLEVQDDGCGMDDETKSQIFEPFFTSKPRNEVAGLGLSLVYSVVVRSGGTFDVASRPECGTTFQMYFPRFDVDRRTSAPDMHPVPPSTSAVRPCLMVVENDDNVRKLLVSTLGAKGFSILEAADGEEALEVASRNINHLDLVVTEVAMPQILGPELVTRLSLLRPDLGVLYISSYPKPTNWDAKGSEPNRSFLFKPFSPGELLARVEFLLSARGQRMSESKSEVPQPRSP